jgi:hypothetical protein
VSQETDDDIDIETENKLHLARVVKEEGRDKTRGRIVQLEIRVTMAELGRKRKA